jgi:ketosteroid isomerase-like protein
MTQSNVDIVRALYDARVKDDFAGFMSRLSPDVTCESVGRTDDYPMLGERRGHDAVNEFFLAIQALGTFNAFEIQRTFAVEDRVFALGHLSFTVAKTGKLFESDFVHMFTIAGGEVTGFR